MTKNVKMGSNAEATQINRRPQRFFGRLSAEIYYVREGQVNEYALHFTVPVPADVEEISFTWQSLAKKHLPYRINIVSPDLIALPKPSMNISWQGEIPEHIETFAIGLRCSGRESAEVDVTITVEVTLDQLTGNATELVFRRKKICLMRIDDQLRVKLADNSLSRDLFPSDYYCLGDSENRPIKWLALESIQFKQFNEASDTWAFGVLMWELCTLARQPYAEVDPFEMEHYLRDGYRLSQPINCPDELFAIMAYCWTMLPMERPSFEKLQICLQDFYAQLTRYV
ncbi:AGAP008009-PA-like protein [Anopheles sinensis]|uniref:AGAP008009-PA-like protein n=1 Tax=Anopheles sinensis TaxID=74873 RepID=A0A084WCM2_ANOSI|nr:AGAP008009-PA-like protein [Anopheles sinensis]